MPLTEGEKKETIAYIRAAERLLTSGGADGTGHKKNDLYPVLTHVLNVLKRLCGDPAPLV